MSPLLVLISPFKAFREIVEDPHIGGPVFILALALVIAVGRQAINASRTLLGQPNREYISLLESGRFVDALSGVVVFTSFQFILSWGLYVLILMFLLKAFREEPGSLRILFAVVGHAFAVLIVYSIVTVLLVSMLPIVTLEQEVWNPPLGEEESAAQLIDETYRAAWYDTLPFQLLSSFYFVSIFMIWTAILVAIALHSLYNTPWSKAGAISAVTFVFGYLLGITPF